jgi:hypothetical protein
MKQLLIATALILAPAMAATGEPLVGLTLTNQLVRFSSTNPGSVTTSSITGLTAGDMLVGIDQRPADNLLYGVAIDSGPGGANTGVGRIYTINPTTGAATLASTLAADPADSTAPFPFASVTGSFFGVDFNPVVDRLRVVSDTGQNLRINVATGLTQFDVAAAYAGSDANAGSPHMVVASAYNNNTAGAGSTTLFALDAALSTLDTQAPANDGTLNTLAIASSSIFADSTFDISGATGTGYVVLDGLTLATINLATGEVTEVGVIGTVGSISGLTAIVPEPGSLLMAAPGLLLVALIRRRLS